MLKQTKCLDKVVKFGSVVPVITKVRQLTITGHKQSIIVIILKQLEQFKITGALLSKIKEPPKK